MYAVRPPGPAVQPGHQLRRQEDFQADDFWPLGCLDAGWWSLLLPGMAQFADCFAPIDGIVAPGN
jgi:hypothetical protein